jgi:hypothetical protein
MMLSQNPVARTGWTATYKLAVLFVNVDTAIRSSADVLVALVFSKEASLRLI